MAGRTVLVKLVELKMDACSDVSINNSWEPPRDPVSGNFSSQAKTPISFGRGSFTWVPDTLANSAMTGVQRSNFPASLVLSTVSKGGSASISVVVVVVAAFKLSIAAWNSTSCYKGLLISTHASLRRRVAIGTTYGNGTREAINNGLKSGGIA